LGIARYAPTKKQQLKGTEPLPKVPLVQAPVTTSSYCITVVPQPKARFNMYIIHAVS